MVTILIPAAGASSRMTPRDKLLETIGGVALLRRQVLRALATGCEVLVTLPPDRPDRAVALLGLDCKQHILPDAADGMSASLRHGAKAAPETHALLVLLPDMPEIETEDIARLIAAHDETPDQVIRASDADGTPGHPVVLPARLRDKITRLTGDRGARPLLEQDPARLVALPGRRALIDLDTPADWNNWRAENPDQA
ncbi:NTP transferase domain-containing protein [Roseovarius sp.]|uniref:nucleotidyltransferase family protein n=1 Tax=Roseovarius sp. TaxID=1486281 RepID=UPI003511982F